MDEENSNCTVNMHWILGIKIGLLNYFGLIKSLFKALSSKESITVLVYMSDQERKSNCIFISKQQ